MALQTRKTLGAAVAAALLFICCLALQQQLAARRDSAWALERLTFLPRSEALRPLLLGYTTAFANFLWIRTTLYFGDHALTDRRYPHLVTMVDMVTRLNPDFFPPYEFAGLLLPQAGHNPDAARVILERGMSGSLGARRWQLAFYCGMLYFKYYNDPQRAAEYIGRAAQVPGAPVSKLAGVAATFYQRSGSAEQARALLLFLYETAQSPAIREYLAQQLRNLESGAP